MNLKSDRLNASGLTAQDVRNAIVAENSTLPGGNVKEGFSDLYVRTVGEFDNISQILETIISTVDGKPIRVRDVAEVEDGFEDVGRLVSINDEPMIRMGIRKQTGSNTVEVSQAIYQ